MKLPAASQDGKPQVYPYKGVSSEGFSRRGLMQAQMAALTQETPQAEQAAEKLETLSF